MRMFTYYAVHSFINQIRKLFKTWVAIFFVICFVMGVGIGLTASFISSSIDDQMDDSAYTEQVSETLPVTEKEKEQNRQLLELVSGGVILAVFGFCAFTADKSASVLFLPADVPVLFASPMRPQSVLGFRLSMQAGAIIAGSLCFFFQLPNLIDMGLSPGSAVALVLTWFLTFAWGKILQVFLYIFGSTHAWFKRNLRYILFGVLAAIGIAFYGYFQSSGQSAYVAAILFFNGKYSCLIPVWGWLKAIVVCSVWQEPLWLYVAVAATVAGGAAAVYFIWQMKADYYEDALAKCEEKAELMAAEAEGKAFRQNRKMDRTDKVLRDGLNRGTGANIYFWKSMYNRFRFAHFRVFTKTSEIYLAAGVSAALALRFLFHSSSYMPVFALIAVFAFFRTLGDGLIEDIAMGSFILIPENMWAKLWYSMLGCLTNCVLDLLPGMVAACLILQAAPLSALLWFVLILTMYFYATSVEVFIDLSVPASVKQIKTLIKILFIYFGLIPDILCIALALVFSRMWIGMLLAMIINCLIGSAFFLTSPLFLTNGRK